MANSSIYDAFERLWQHSNNKFVDKNNLGSAAYTEIADYDTRGKADAALASAKTYADGKADAALASAKTYADEIKNNLLNGAGAAYDTLKELGELIDENQDTIETLENIANGKADAVHIHAISEISGLQDALDNNTTPVKGVDYWTEADQESIVQQVITALPVYNGEVV